MTFGANTADGIESDGYRNQFQNRHAFERGDYDQGRRVFSEKQ